MSLSPAPGAAPLPRMIMAQAGFETRLLLRNGEQLLLTAVIPVVLLAVLSAAPIIDTGRLGRVDFLVPGVIALAVMSTAFTSLAIATGYERRHGVLKRLAASPLPRWALLVSKALTVLVVELAQIVLVVGLGVALGWRPGGTEGPGGPGGATGAVASVVLLVVVGTLAFGGLGLLLAGTVRAEVTLAAANLVYLLLLVFGGVVVPVESFPAALRELLLATPAGALSEGLRSVLADGADVPWGRLALLAAWAGAGFAAAARWFRWE